MLMACHMSSTEVLLGDAAICNIHLVPLKFLCNHHNIKPFDMLMKFNTFEIKNISTVPQSLLNMLK